MKTVPALLLLPLTTVLVLSSHTAHAIKLSSRAVAFSGQKSSRNSVGIGKPIAPRRTSFVAPSDPGHAIMAEIPPWLSHVQGFKGAGTPREALEAVGTIGMGSFWGVCAGAMAKRLSMQLAFAVGMGAIGVKVAEDAGYLRINWEKIDRDIRAVGRDLAGHGPSSSMRVRAEQLMHSARRTLEENVGTAGGFAAGFAYGFRAG